MIQVSIVIPVYRGATTLDGVVAELSSLIEPRTSPGGRSWRVSEVVLVWDCGPDSSDQTIRALAARYDWVRPLYLSRNFGQHPATLAGMASSGGDWVVTLDEDGQHDPASIGPMLDRAFLDRTQLVYGVPTNPPPHTAARNMASKLAKQVFVRFLAGGEATEFSSYRLVLGEVARSVSAYAGAGVFLDVALGWVVGRTASWPVQSRSEGRSATSYSWRRLASHFWRLVVSSGTRPLRLVSGLGFTLASLGVLLSAIYIVRRVTNDITVQGWTTVIVAQLLVGGAILFSLGVIAEYVGASLKAALGRPLYVIVQDPEEAYGERRH
jgi:glycosyltransferase involved in cell wall biosynthesis